ncbi:acid phosphatase 1-like [Tripterygium wilfordii]|uniref:Acid phosphatase 1-like n=1 Tax=Tripterygium wilfordii TaxID=458696 RepID=A0A7J7D1H1_TRIWF|nr:acid phosphatase 1-like [Tripterygium wilfordii]
MAVEVLHGKRWWMHACGGGGSMGAKREERGPLDQGVPATVYKSQKRKQLVDDGYRIRGNSGDQWSDLLGFAVAKRSFKRPNPMYYIA